jgi:cytoplasmic tRNA 2-thiolation protein 1
VPTRVKRSKPLKYAYEKEIVLYAHHRGLRYFSTECVYSPEAFRGGARALVKDLERARPSAILDLVRSGEEMARLCPGYVEREAACRGDCAGAVADEEDEAAGAGGCGRGTGELPAVVESAKAEKPEAEARPRLERPARAPKQAPKQTIGVCERCGYMSSQAVCKACLLLESLNRNRPKTDIEVTLLPKDRDVAVT